MEKISRKEQLLKELQDLEDLNTEETEEDNGVVYKDPLEHMDEPIQADKKDTKTEVKEKKPRTAKQIEAFEKARETREKNALARKQSRDEEAIAIRKQVEDKLVKKAIAVKKKQIKQQAVLDEISDDDTPLEEVEKIATRSVAKTRLKREVAKDFPAPPPPAQEPVTPKYYFL
tara:strand:- start:131 stop:649 length:519 start_codon:yes stop_codon:yes gene_type:complete